MTSSPDIRVLVTGGSGFIGSNFIKYLLISPEVQERVAVANLDDLTYAADGKNLEHMGISKHSRYQFFKGDICDRFFVNGAIWLIEPDYIFHFAAESHVDRSLQDDAPFKRTNVIGTGTLLAALAGSTRFVHISTDEVYGSTTGPSFKETDETNPGNPYARTKEHAEVLARHYAQVHGKDVIITRSANNYGPYQFPEKFLPKSITEILNGRNIPLMWSPENPGLNVRDWLHVEDNCRAIWHLALNGNSGETYNIPGENERTNIEVARMILAHYGFQEDRITRSKHREKHDFRYSIDGTKLKQTGFQYTHLDLEKGIDELCTWYSTNSNWWRPLKKQE